MLRSSKGNILAESRHMRRASLGSGWRPKAGIAAAAAEQPDLADCGRKPIESLGG
jgi:hypothetical protein